MCSMFIRTTLFLFYTACIIILSNKARTNALLIITPPSSSNDFRQLASLLASSFDAPAPARTTTTSSTSKATIPPPPPAEAAAAGKQQNATNGKLYIETLKLNVEWFYWNLVEKALTEQYTYNQYVSTVQKMRGKKYALLVAKEEEDSINHDPMTVTKEQRTKNNDATSSDSLSFAGKGDVVGMIEMGMTVYPPMMNEPRSKRRRRRTTTARNDDEQEQSNQQQIEEDKETEEEEEEKSHRNNDSAGCQKLYNTTTLLPTYKQPPQLVPTIGVICVKSTHQREGIGKSLVEKCKYVAKHVWNETCLFADVEPSNVGALRFLVDSCGFRVMPTNDDENCYGTRGVGVMMRNATVSRRRKMESRPHIVLYSRLDDDDDIMDGLYVTRGEE